MTTSPHVCLVGQIMVDVTLPAHGHPFKLRAGGIMHAARALWALDCAYSLAYCSPDYLEAEIAEHAQNYGANTVRRFGVVAGCPNVMLIAEPKEAGPQGYEFLLRERQQCSISIDDLQGAIGDSISTDILIFPGGFDLGATLPVIGKSKASIHVDANFEPSDSDGFALLGRPFETLILSTSSQSFLDKYKGDYRNLCDDLLGRYGTSVLLKENRGGSRFFSRDGKCTQTPAQRRKVQHSVGVGDCFDAVFVTLRHKYQEATALAYASCIAAEYACTTFPVDFKDAAQSWLRVPEGEILELVGTCLPWEKRSAINVYIAAPDFDHVDRRPIDTVAECLKYHNFVPRLPVREHGQMGTGATIERRQTLCEADLRLLDECQLVLAVLIYDDPGTLIEIGIAVERQIPVVVFDPYNRADNLMLTQLPFLVSSDLDEVISGLFECAARIAGK